MSKFLLATPRFAVRDMVRTVAFYREILGFAEDIIWPADNPVFAALQRDNVSISFFTNDGTRPDFAMGSAELYIDVENVLELHAQLKDKVAIEWGPEVYFYHRREFAVRDPDRYLVIFSEPTDDPPTCPEE